MVFKTLWNVPHILNYPEKKPLENIMEKEENAVTITSPFPTIFPLFSRLIPSI